MKATRAILPALVALSLACGQDSLTGSNPGAEAAKEPAKKPAPKPAAKPAVQVGLDVLETESPPRLRGKKVGLVVNIASVAADGRSAIDVLQKHGVDVVRLFTPEHGLQGRAAAGQKITDGKEAGRDLPIVSLYGEKTKPAPADLQGLDALVFDLQDVGVRFYTYISTLILCLESAGEAGIEFVVLDRPNPLGGERIEGPVSDRAAVPASLLNTAPGPLVHGLTAGEMARFVNASRPKPARLTVIAMKGWSRGMTWTDTGRAWVPPSPNLRDPEAAVAYPGTALLERTNVSEGRGTDAPFLLLGAPWVKAAELVAAVTVPGFSLEVAKFTPQPSEAAPDPKHKGVECAGVRVHVTDPKAARPYTLGVALLRALRAQPGFEMRDKGAALERLMGTPKLREALERGDTVEAIVQADAKDIEAFRTQRKAALLY